MPVDAGCWHICCRSRACYKIWLCWTEHLVNNSYYLWLLLWLLVSLIWISNRIYVIMLADERLMWEIHSVNSFRALGDAERESHLWQQASALLECPWARQRLSVRLGDAVMLLWFVEKMNFPLVHKISVKKKKEKRTFRMSATFSLCSRRARSETED